MMEAKQSSKEFNSPKSKDETLHEVKSSFVTNSDSGGEGNHEGIEGFYGKTKVPSTGQLSKKTPMGAQELQNDSRGYPKCASWHPMGLQNVKESKILKPMFQDLAFCYNCASKAPRVILRASKCYQKVQKG